MPTPAPPAWVRKTRIFQGLNLLSTLSFRAKGKIEIPGVANRTFGNRTHKKVPVRLCPIAEPIELQSNDWVRLGSIGFWFGFVRLATPGNQNY